ncbi:MAG: hypothetical protein COA94_03965 [Rickettsiales bacterium]|nr:MAG: hypothetical protein COA94_03965 [Rickettsiales bacterium]
MLKARTFLRTKAEKATLEAETATKAKTNFLAFTAHEIRSPLGFIITGSEMMAKGFTGKLSKQHQEYAEGIHENAQQILEFLSDILDESQIIEGKFKIRNTQTQLEDVINEAIKVNLARYHKKKINVVSKMEENLPLLICDRRRILQVLSNLISNSLKYSDDHTTITLTGKVVNNKMEVQIIDEGIGMDEKGINIALSSYGTLEHGRHYSDGSYGLGLPIVKMLLNAHDATLSIKSEKSKGTVVKIVFPKYKLVYNAPNLDKTKGQS